jgi:hypothetical protein
MASESGASSESAGKNEPIGGVRERQQEAGIPQQMKVDESGIHATYANFVRVTGTPEELIVDFGLNKQVSGDSPDPILLTQRLVLNFFTAKRLAAALQMAVQRHEMAFGVLETDVQRRLQPGLRAGSPSK